MKTSAKTQTCRPTKEHKVLFSTLRQDVQINVAQPAGEKMEEHWMEAKKYYPWGLWLLESINANFEQAHFSDTLPHSLPLAFDPLSHHSLSSRWRKVAASTLSIGTGRKQLSGHCNLRIRLNGTKQLAKGSSGRVIRGSGALASQSGTQPFCSSPRLAR